MAHDENNGNWDWRRRRRSPSVILVRQFVPVNSLGAALSNPGVSVDCYLTMENIRAAYNERSERLKNLIAQCQILSKEYLQIKLGYVRNPSAMNLSLLQNKERQVYDLTLQKNALEEEIKIIYNQMVSASC